jgi:hypothetical protein
MNEEFCFWSFTQWKDALRETGFEIIEQEVSGKSLSRSYCNPWIIEHRFNEKVRITSLDGKPHDFPPTNMVLVAEKPQLHQANQNPLT